jgi:hypothetical protein
MVSDNGHLPVMAMNCELSEALMHTERGRSKFVLNRFMDAR